MSLSYEEVTPQNVDLAIKIQNEIFPDENGCEELIAASKGESTKRAQKMTYFIAFTGKEPIGICGKTEYTDYPEDCWLGWYGVLAPHRRKGYGREMFNFIKNLATFLGYKTLRLYTDEIDNSVAVITYKKYGMHMEVYENPNDLNIVVGRTLIFSLPLDGKPLVPWNNRMIYLAEEYETEAKYKK